MSETTHALPHGFYITGTNTGAGKTVASAAILHALRARGQRAVGMKPLASGCDRVDGQWRNEDALALQRASDPGPSYVDVNPYALRLPLAPELAAAEAGVEVRLDVILAAYQRLRAQADVVVVEGVGGWAAPLSRGLDQADLVRVLDLPVVLVVGLRLGCINHARLTTRALQQDGVHLAGWIGTQVDPDMACQQENLAMLQQRLPVPYWGYLPHADPVDPAAMARHLSIPLP